MGVKNKKVLKYFNSNRSGTPLEINSATFKDTYKPIAKYDINSGISAKDLEGTRSMYEMFIWTVTNDNYIINGRVLSNAKSFIVCRNPHNVDSFIYLMFKQYIQLNLKTLVETDSWLNYINIELLTNKKDTNE